MSDFLTPLAISLAGRDADPAFAPAWAATRAAAEASRSSAMQGRDVADRPSGWGHNYYCPTHGNPLTFAEDQPDRHRCAEFEHDVTGELFDAGWATLRNATLVEHLAASALAAAITNDSADAKRATGILTQLAEVYPDLPLHGRNVGQGRLTAQSLEEAMAATSLTRSHALVASWMTAEQRALVADRLFRPMVEVLQDHLMNRIHNIEVWHLAGLASLAVVLEDQELADFTLDSTFGLTNQLAEGVLADGWWMEGSPTYHFFTITALLAAVESHQAMGMDSAAAATLERMLLVPLGTARNDLTVPVFNDGWLAPAIPPGLGDNADLYVHGARLTRSAQLHRFLDSRLAAGFDRTSPIHLVYGQAAAEDPAPDLTDWPVTRLDVLPDSGYAILRQPDADQVGRPDTCVFLKFGPHGGGHGHPDKLEIELMIDGSRVVADPGTGAYTNPIHGSWYTQTWSHSTVLVDRISQPPIKGRLLGHQQVTADRFGCADALVGFGAEPDSEGVDVLWRTENPAAVAAYAGVTIRRFLAMVPPELGDYLLDLVLVRAPSPKTIDLVNHVRGEFVSPADRRAADRLLLPQFDDVRLAEHPSGHTDYILSDLDAPWTRWHTGAEELLTATTPSNPTHERCASTVERVVGHYALFAAVLPLGRSRLTQLRTPAADTILVDVDGGTHRWTLAPDLRADPAAAFWTTPPIELSAF